MDMVVRNRVLARVVVFVYADGMVPKPFSLSFRERARRRAKREADREESLRPPRGMDFVEGLGLVPLGYSPERERALAEARQRMAGTRPIVSYTRPDGTVIPASDMTDAERANCERLAEERSRFKW